MEVLPSSSSRTSKRAIQPTTTSEEKNIVEEEVIKTLFNASDEAEKGEGQTAKAQEHLSFGALLIVEVCMVWTNVINGFAVILNAVLLELLAEDLKLTGEQLTLLAAAWLLALVAGRASDIAGGKAVFIVGTVWQGLCTLVTGFTIFRLSCLGGSGAALNMASNVGIIVENSVPGRTRSIMIGICIAGLPFGNAAGCLSLGLWDRQKGLPMVPLIGIFFVKNRRPASTAQSKKIDWLGGILLTAGFCLLFFCLSQALSEDKGWGTAYIIALLVVSVLFIGVAVAWQYYLEFKTDFPPILRMSILSMHRGTVGILLFVTLLTVASVNVFQCAVTAAYEGETPLSL
ncbi:hypothetical protein QFC21_004541 [Naganishia friedmannii]|uniref:Uncharacterized protein n=1 Tax=Naganishia friedmannii TaxID=89922 RepID=A0ACC2VFW3_9TREE|nr:hypothetical protein QFC21_004541 [Naganishia friedmannii]